MPQERDAAGRSPAGPEIPVFKPLIRPAELGAATEALEMGWLGMGGYVGEFEAALLKAIGAPDRFVVALSTGHAALHLGLLLAGVGPGDEVITPSFNNVADFQAILATGASPVFCDVDPDTLCIDVDRAEELVGARTKAVVAMDYGCLACDHGRLQKLGEAHGLRIVHDAAHSFGSSYDGRPIGSFSDICMFSFDPVKTVTCIDGGALVVQTEAEQLQLREMRLIGMGQRAEVMYEHRRAWTHDVARLGFRYHMANLHAAVGLAQLASLPAIAASRRGTCRYYNERFAALPGVRVPATDFEGMAPFLYYLRVPASRRDALRAFMGDRGVDTGIHWQPGHWFSLFRDCRRGDLGVTEQVGREILTLPLHSMMRDEDAARVADAVVEFFAAAP